MSAQRKRSLSAASIASAPVKTEVKREQPSTESDSEFEVSPQKEVKLKRAQSDSSVQTAKRVRCR